MPQHLGTKIIVTEQSVGEVVVLAGDVEQGRLVDPQWRWSAADDAGIPRGCWGLPNDVRLRSDDAGQQVLISDSLGLLAQVDYPEGGEARWFLDLGPEADPHGIELLPGGWLATAASQGHFVRVYAPGPDRSSTLIAEATLHAAHQVLWDEAHGLLWVLGGDELVAYQLPADAVGADLEARHRYPLPTPAGHDLQPIPGDPERLWVTTVEHVYLFEIGSGAFVSDYPGTAFLDRDGVKSVGTAPELAAVLQTQMITDAGTYEWTTDRIDVTSCGSESDGSGVVSLFLPEAEIYRARWFDERSC